MPRNVPVAYQICMSLKIVYLARPVLKLYYAATQPRGDYSNNTHSSAIVFLEACN
jgi:hypothetical protein